MADDSQIRTGTSNEYKSDRGGATLQTEPVIGIVKNNIDPTHSGKIKVYIAKFGGQNPNDESSWTSVAYVSPFSGLSGVSGTPGSGSTTEGYGKFVGNPQSYGFWASAPDIGTEVICIFVDGVTQNGYYIGCIPSPGLNSMTPAIGSSSAIVPNDAEAKTYGGADRLPTTEVNSTNPNLAKSATITSDPKPIHSYQASILFNQGIIRDNSRGVISSSAQRESPSRVFGMSTPGGPIYAGGYTNSTIASAATSATDAKLQTIGRTGGHTLVMDDGGLQGEDTLMRFRSSAGHMIMMNDSAQALFIIHANGQSWIELGKEGTIDMYATNSVNIRSAGDLNLHADRDLNLHAAKNIKMYADNILTEADTNMSIRTGATFAQQTVGKHTVKATGDLSLASSASASLAAGSAAYINGTKVNLNTGNTGTTPADVPVIPKVNHPDTAYSVDKGWLFPAPKALLSVTSRAPTHQPFVGSGKGVNVKVDSAVDTSAPVTTSKVDKINNSTPNVPKRPTTPAINASVPTQKSTKAVQGIDDAAITSMVGQQAASNSTLPTGGNPSRAVAGSTITGQTPVPQTTVAGAVVPKYVAPSDTKRGDGILTGPGGVTIEQACGPGMMLKPGTQDIVASNIAQGMPMDKAIQGLVTGNMGATNATQALQSVPVQSQVVAANLNNAASRLVNAGMLTGLESAGQAGGVVMAASSYGVGALTNAVNGVVGTANTISANVIGIAQGVTNEIVGAVNTVKNISGKINDAIAQGNFAGSLSDSISNGISGLANSVTGAIKGAINSITSTVSSLAASLVGTLRAAFKTVEASFKNLTANTSNIIGTTTNTVSAVDLTSSSAKYNSAKADLDMAQSNYDDAVTSYRNNPDDINKTVVDSAESQLSSARQKVAASSSNIISGGVGSLVASATAVVTKISAGVSNLVSSPATTQNSGINALPGGVASITNQVTATGANAVSAITNGALSVKPENLTGNLVGNTAGAVTGIVAGAVNTATGAVTGVVNAGVGIVTGAVNAVAGIAVGAVTAISNTISAIVNLPAQIVKSIFATANGIISSIQTTLASIGNMGGQIKASITATNTFNKAPMTAKNGQLLGEKVPTPHSLTSTPTDTPPATPTANVDSSLQQKSDKLKQISELQVKTEELQAQADALYAQYTAGQISLANYNTQSTPILQQKRDLIKQKIALGKEYESIVADSNEPKPDSRLTSGPTASYFSTPRT